MRVSSLDLAERRLNYFARDQWHPRKTPRALTVALCALVAVSSALSGCANQRAVLINGRGDELTCEAGGWGFIGSLATYNKQDECIAEAQKKGYQLKKPND